jgi:uncharacterized protein YbjT (DUF2867 family)
MAARIWLVVGAAGEVGAATTDALAARGERARVLVRASAPRHREVEIVEGDLSDRASLDRALVGVAGVSFVTPHHPDEERLGENLVAAATAAGVTRLVYSAAARPMSRIGVVDSLLVSVTGLLGPHYRAKLRVARRVRRSGLSPVVLLPSNFYQNDELGLDEILEGRYPHPLGGRPLNRVDVRDIGDAAARALLDPGVAAGAYPILGPENWTGASSAATWAEALGRPITYAGDELDPWRESMSARMPKAKADDFAKTYRLLQLMGYRPPRWAYARSESIVGHPARRYGDYVAERARDSGVTRSSLASRTSSTATS